MKNIIHRGITSKNIKENSYLAIIKAIKDKDSELANKELKTVIANIDKACSKGLVKKNTCARQKSRLNKKVKEMEK